MFKRTLILSFVAMSILAGSCKSIRNTGSDKKLVKSKEVNIDLLTEIVKSKNISNNGFIIRKAKIELDSKSFSGNFSLNAKVREDGKFVASVRGPLGIEVIRVYCDEDSIFIINRFDHTISAGRRNVLFEREGIPFIHIGLILGDVPVDAQFKNGIISGNGEISAHYEFEHFIVRMMILPDIYKLKEEYINSELENGIIISFANFKNSGEKIYPASIIIKSEDQLFHVKIEIEEFENKFTDEIIIKLPEYRIINL